MNLDDLKDRLKSEWQTSWEKFQDSSLYQQAKDRFENLTPQSQKIVLILLTFLIAFLLLSYPLSFFTSSQDSLTQFSETRELIVDLHEAVMQSQEAPSIMSPPIGPELQSRFESELNRSNLLPEQVKAIELHSDAIPGVAQKLTQGGARVVLSKLNVRQVVDVGHSLQTVSPSIKMVDLVLEPNAQDPRYFDVQYKFVALNVPSQDMPTEPTEEAPKRGRRR